MKAKNLNHSRPVSANNSYWAAVIPFGVQPLGCQTPPDTLKRGHQTRTQSQNQKRFARLIAAALFLASAGSALAEVRYVDVSSTNATPPYGSWATAATNIQDAVDAAVAGDEIVVTNGIYAVGARATIDRYQITTTNRVVVDKPITVRSLNGPQSTMIDGGGVFRCVYLTNGTSLSGFTLTNGRAHEGGGLWCESADAVVSNCVVSGNSSFWGNSFLGVGQICCIAFQTFAGGVYGGTLYDCTLSGNRAETDTFRGFRCDLGTCTASGNGHIQTYYSFGAGGGAANATLNNCTLTANWAATGGGAYGCILNNCTLTDNSGGYGGAYSSTLNNCIAYFNTGANYDSSSTLNYSCTTPMPTNGVGNIANEPAFVNLVAGNYRLRADSPCIDAGTNLSATIIHDLDGRPRPLDGNGDGLSAFDMGAYEYRTPLLVWQDSPDPTFPHSNWTNAAHTIQDAVDAATAGDEIVVTNGIYATAGRSVDGITTNRVAVDKPLSLRSINGPQSTTIEGSHSNRCVYLTNGASLSGFTLTNGAARYGGGGLFCESTNAVASNCVLSGNVTGIRRFDSNAGGGAYGGTLDNCTLTANSAGGAGGGAYNATLNNSTLSSNSAFQGGGVDNCTVNNCRLAGNVAVFGGGASTSTLTNCELTGNSTTDFGGGAGGTGGGEFGCTLNNCTVTGNRAEYTGGGASGGTLNNCTLSGNSARWGGGAADSTLNNCIVYFNQGANYDSYSTLNYSCTTPLPTNGAGNITNVPLFADLVSGNLRLQPNSPCINAGLNALAPAGLDLDGNPRIASVDGTVDIGAYEFQWPASRISYAWLQQYALPTDGSADNADPDSDGLNNWQEWRCATDPTNALSALRLLATVTGGTNVIVSWQSIAGMNYFLERSTNLAGLPTFSPLAANLAGQPGTTTFSDTNAIAAGPWFYRVGTSTP